MCGRDVAKTDRYCSYCGENNAEYEEPKKVETNMYQTPNYQTRNRVYQEDRLGFWMGLLTVIFPIVGIVLFFVYKSDRPNAAKTALIIALIMFGVTFLANL